MNKVAIIAAVAFVAFVATAEARMAEKRELLVDASSSFACNTSLTCGNGICDTTVSMCNCNDGWVDRDGQACSYELKSKLVAFLLSFFVGGFGADWFYLARGNGGYIAAGVFKLLTGAGCCIWGLVDWIRVLANGFKDGNGVDLKPW